MSGDHELPLLFPLLHNPHFDAPSFLTLFVFSMLRPPWKEIFSVRNALSATDASFVLVAGYSLIYRVVHLPFTLEHSFSSIIISPQAFYMLASTVSSGFGHLQLGTLALALSRYCTSAF